MLHIIASGMNEMQPDNQGNVQLCTVCGLASTVPSARIDDEGICVYCRQFKGKQELDLKREKFRADFVQLLQACLKPKAPYDILVAYSGGKDSTFTLDLLKNQFNLRILAMTFDHGFVSPYAFENIRKVVETLGVDHVFYKPSFKLMAEVFRYSIENEFHPPKALERASSICNSCMGLVKFITLRTALEKNIPLIAYGWSPGQAPMQSAILKNQPSFIRKAQELFLNPLQKAAGPEIRAFFLDNAHFQLTEFPYNVNPLGFLAYSEEAIYKRIAELGWRPPADTDANSTNCLMNGFANSIHIQKHRYHPYAMELAELVREGVLSREEAIERLSQEPDPRVIAMAKEKLSYR